MSTQTESRVRSPGLILLSTTIRFSEFNDAACALASPLLRTPPLSGRTSVRLPTWWLAFGRVGLDGFRHLTHWVTLTSFKSCQLYSHVPSLSRREEQPCSSLARVRFNAGGQPGQLERCPSPRSFLAGRGTKIITEPHNPGRRSCLACPGLLSGHPYGISFWIGTLAGKPTSKLTCAAPMMSVMKQGWHRGVE